MPSNQKQVATHTFVDGIDTVTSAELSKNTTARYILNCHTVSTGVGNVGIVTNVKGNTYITTPLHEGINKTIGTCEDEEKGVFYFFVWNSLNYHGIFKYDEISNTITKIVESITDFAGKDILNFSKDYLILMADIINNKMLYWVDGLNDARKINVNKALDKSSKGYGVTILEEFINANKLQPVFAPVASYDSDVSVTPSYPNGRTSNYLYGKLRKFAYRYKYDDGEWSNYSDFSNVATPAKESFTGVNTVPTDNNVLKIKFNTGSLIVNQIELVMFEPTLELQNPEWDIIATIDKKQKGIGDNVDYIYTFYNDGSYPKAISEKIQRPYSYLPSKPLCQTVAQGCMVYSNFNEGFENVPLDVDIAITYKDLFIDSGTVPIENKPNFDFIAIANTAVILFDRNLNRGELMDMDGVIRYVYDKKRANSHKITIGNDVKKGNRYTGSLSNGVINISIDYTALINDSAITVAFQIKQQIVSQGGFYIIKQIRGNEDSQIQPIRSIWDDTDVMGNISFEFSTVGEYRDGYFAETSHVDSVNINTLKDTGQSISNMKLGAGTKYGIVYTNEQRTRSLVYTDDKLNTTTSTENSLGSIKAPKVRLTVKHTPPIWAKYWEVVRTDDLTFNYFIDLLIQKVINVQSTNTGGDYLDLVVGSLYTYQKIHPNTTLKYEFKKGDRIRLKKKEDGSYYPDLETEILSYNENTVDRIDSNLTTNGSTSITVSNASADNIGKFIRVNGYERLIESRTSATTYTLNNTLGDATAKTYFSYELVDRRGLLRIRKPGVSTGITITDNSLVEIFNPTKGGNLGAKQFYHFNKKFDVINYGLPTRVHSGNIQNQTAGQNAIVDITEGTVYVRNRELPTTNSVPNAQVVIKVVEDPAYSDFYYSELNDNGRVNVEDNKLGVVHFGDRMRFSGIELENTAINGLNDFNNLDRKDYNDGYGDIKLTLFTESQILTFKSLKDCIVPVFQTVIQDKSGQELLGASKKLLNDIRYYTHDGGIGNNPESYARNENQHYHLSPNSGSWVRLSGDGVTPISELYQFDNEARRLIAKGVKNGTKFFGGFDRLLKQVVWHIEGYATKTLSTVFDSVQFEILSPELTEGATQAITVNPTHGAITFAVNGNPIYTPYTDYVGADSFQYTSNVLGTLVTRKVCLTIKPTPVNETAWRAKQSSFFCVLNGYEDQTGYKGWATLEQYYVADGKLTGEEKVNDIYSPDYNAPVYDDVACTVTATVYSSVLKSVSIQRNNCDEGYMGSYVTYTITAGAYTSTISQLDANAKAQNALDMGKQSYANNPANGATCTMIPPSGVYSIIAKYSVTELDICGSSFIEVWIDGTIAYDGSYTTLRSGRIVYTTSDLDTPLTGFNYILDDADDLVRQIDSATGEVGAATGSTC